MIFFLDFSWGSHEDLSREAKCGEISFYPLETKKSTFCAKNLMEKCYISKSRVLGPCLSPSDANEHWPLSLGRSKGKTFRERPFALHRQ